jgi:predicted DsbA family dithiol-disulfide isomerase
VSGMEIEVYSDVVCPWCYLGKARLDAALATYRGEAVVRWRAFQLDPGAGREPVVGRLARKFGSDEAARRAIARVTALGEAEGLTFDYDRAVSADTFDAHRLLWFADRPEAVLSGATADTQARLAEALHRAHFTDGLDLAAADVLASLAAEVGLAADRVRRLLASGEGYAEVRGQLAHARALGITAVPTFVFAGRYAVAGAQSADVLRSVLDEVARLESAPDRPLIPGQRADDSCADDSCLT